jgi:hypothetical protein
MYLVNNLKFNYMKKVVLQRQFQGQDSWGAFKEQVTIDENNNLDYRMTEGGNCCFGNWEDYQGEEMALRFIFGEINLTSELIIATKNCLQNQKELKDDEFNMDGY